MEQAFSSHASVSQPWGPLPGPADRVNFFDEQRRNRRATWRMAAACGCALVCVGLPLSLVLSPLLYALALIVLNTLHLFAPIPGALEMLHSAGSLAFAVLEYASDEPGPNVELPWLFLGIAAWFIPGVLTVVIIWLGIYTLFRHAGVGSIVLSLGARPPKAGDLEEQQLRNLVEEMALAAGVPRPRLVLLDTAVVNAAAVGSSAEDATLIVSRRLLDALDRDQTQGVIGHLVGSMGNGDLRIAFLMSSVLLTFGFLVAILKAPFGARGRAAFFQLLRLGFKEWRHQVDEAAERELLKTLITDGVHVIDTEEKETPVVLMPFLLASLSVQWTLYVLIPGLLTPILALLWRTRRYLADATAVQLTRNPDGIARALLAARWAVMPGSQAVAHLFMIGPVGAESVAELLNWEGVGFHPPLRRRLRRLQALGAYIEVPDGRRPSAWSDFAERQPLLAYVLRGVVAILLPITAAVCLAAIVLFVFISLFATMILLLAIYGVFMALGALKGWMLT